MLEMFHEGTEPRPRYWLASGEIHEETGRDANNVYLKSLESDTTRSVSPIALGRTVHEKARCKVCDRWIQPWHVDDHTCGHVSYSPLNKRLFPDRKYMIIDGAGCTINECYAVSEDHAKQIYCGRMYMTLDKFEDYGFKTVPA